MQAQIDNSPAMKNEYGPANLGIALVIGGDFAAGSLPGVVTNLVTADAVDRLWRFFESGDLVGYVGSIRITDASLEQIVKGQVKVVSPAWHDPAGPVIFALEQMSTRPGLVRHYRRLFELEPGAEKLAFWKNLKNGDHALQLVRLRKRNAGGQ
jgi:hypothetical protein